MFVWVTERILKNMVNKKAVDCLWLVRNIISTQILKKAQILKKLPAHPKIIKSCRPAFGFDLIPS